MSTSDVMAAVTTLDKLNDDALYAELGGRLRTIGGQPQLSAQFALPVNFQAEAMGPLDDLRAFGRRFFDRVNRQAYQLVCGSDPENTKDREKVAESMGMGKDMFATTLTTLLVAQLGLAPAIAPVVALLIVRLCFKPALGAMCDVWKEKLGAVPAGT